MTIAGFPRIASDPANCGGRPVVVGTRVDGTDVLEMLAGGATSEEIRPHFSYLKPHDVHACLTWAAHEADHPIVVAAEGNVSSMKRG